MRGGGDRTFGGPDKVSQRATHSDFQAWLDRLGMMEAWKREAACIGAPHHYFFPESYQTIYGSRPVKERTAGYAEGKKICATCPVIHACREYGLANGERHGLWGGCTPRELMRIGRARSQRTAANRAAV